MTDRPFTRRAMLRGAGAAIAIPFLESLAPAAADRAPIRLMFVYKPGGCVMPDWTPKGEGAAFELSSTLAPLQPFKQDIVVLSGLDGRGGETGGNGHPLACSPWLSSAPIGKKDRGGYATDITVDQIAADKIGETTRLRSIELGINQGRADIHTSNISWRGPGSPMGKETNPRAVFSRMFGDPKGDRYRRSILDMVLGDAKAIQKSVGVDDRQKLDEYLDSIRSIEKRIQFVEKSAPIAPPPMKIPEAIPAGPKEHLSLLSDLVALAFQAGSTRVATLMYDNEDMIPPHSDLGIRESHHALVHNNSRPGKPITDRDTQDKVDKLKKIDRFYVERFASLLEKLKGMKEQDGTVLDNCLILFGSGLSWGNLHIRTDLPLVLAGKGGGSLRTGRHLRSPAATPLANLHVSLLERVGVSVERLANSTGPLAGL